MARPGSWRVCAPRLDQVPRMGSARRPGAAARLSDTASAVSGLCSAPGIPRTQQHAQFPDAAYDAAQPLFARLMCRPMPARRPMTQ